MILQKRLSGFKHLGLGLVLIFSYVFLGFLGINLVTLPNTHLTLFWFASGIGLIAFRIFGNRAFFLVLLASLVVNFPFYLASSHYSFSVTLVLGVLVSAGDALQSFFAFKISLQIEKRLGRPLFEKSKDLILYFFLVCTLPAAITCWFFVLVTHFLEGIAFDLTVFLRETGYLTLSDALGLLLIGPLYWGFKYRNVLSYKNIFTRIFLNSLSFLILLLSLFWQPLILILVFPLILLCSTYASLIDAAFSSFCLALLMAAGTANGLGLFVNSNPADSFFNLVLFLLVVVFMRFYLVLNSIDENNREELLQRTEIRYRHIVDSAAVGVFQSIPDGKVLFANSTILNLLEYESIEDINLHGGTPILYKDPKDREALIRIVGTKGRIDNYEIDFVTKNKKPVPVSLTIRLEKDILYGTLTDITERKQAEEALRQAHDELEQRIQERTLELQKTHAMLLHAEKLSAIGQLSASIAHEFNNPLQSVMTVIKGVRSRALLAEKDAQLMELANSECIRMRDLLKSLMDFNRPTSGRKALMDIHAAIDSILVFGKKEYTTKNIVIEKDYAEHMPQIKAVADQLKQVILNLLNNAVDACEHGGTITIRTESGEGNIVVRIEDTGKGIPPEDIAHIFEPFFSTKPAVKGMGLGLSVSYGIVKAHGGEIKVKSEVGKGSIFSVILPLAGEHNEQEKNSAG